MSHETALQNGMLAAVYGLLFFTVLHSSLRRVLCALLWASLLTCIYNIFWDSAIHSRVTAAAALFVRLLPPFEAMFLVIQKQDLGRAIMVCFAFTMVWMCSNPFSISEVPYLTIRNFATIAMTTACVMAASINYASRMSPGVLEQNLNMQALWMILHTAFSFTAPLYNQSWAMRGAARWAYCLCSLAIAVNYLRVLRSADSQPNRPAPQGA